MARQRGGSPAFSGFIGGTLPVCCAVAVGCLVSPASHSAETARADCDTSVYPLSSPTSRFDDGHDGTVTDKQSKLMWMRCALGQSWTQGTCSGQASLLSWTDAEQAAKSINKSGKFFFSDWRLPQLPELASIAERQCKSPRINLEIFPNTVPDFFWSATSRPAGAASAPPASTAPAETPEHFAFALSFGPDGVSYVNKQEQHDVRLVRSAR
jgi:hypothetical protein